jgi:hypothetical protein
MDRNLGALQVATSVSDAASFGDLYQWGRRSDGHQCRTSLVTSVLSSTDLPLHSEFIVAPNTPFDWRSPQNNNLWQGVNGVNNPCPVGYRLPNAEDANLITQNFDGAFASPLKLPGAALRTFGGGIVTSGGGYYWSSAVSSTSARYQSFNTTNATMNSGNRSYGFSVRCIKN